MPQRQEAERERADVRDRRHERAEPELVANGTETCDRWVDEARAGEHEDEVRERARVVDPGPVDQCVGGDRRRDRQDDENGAGVSAPLGAAHEDDAGRDEEHAADLRRGDRVTEHGEAEIRIRIRDQGFVLGKRGAMRLMRSDPAVLGRMQDRAYRCFEPKLLFEALAKGSADSFALRNQGMKALLPDHHPRQAFPVNYMLKDVSYAVEFARKLLFSEVRPTFADLEAHLKGKARAAAGAQPAARPAAAAAGK